MPKILIDVSEAVQKRLLVLAPDFGLKSTTAMASQAVVEFVKQFPEPKPARGRTIRKGDRI